MTNICDTSLHELQLLWCKYFNKLQQNLYILYIIFVLILNLWEKFDHNVPIYSHEYWWSSKPIIKAKVLSKIVELSGRQKILKNYTRVKEIFDECKQKVAQFQDWANRLVYRYQFLEDYAEKEKSLEAATKNNDKGQQDFEDVVTFYLHSVADYEENKVDEDEPKNSKEATANPLPSTGISAVADMMKETLQAISK